ncbi:hypothetical protein D9619_004614 [Psilocybe cf. subviscida]|uniref:Zinc finger PHD-type domain-containing protein n=1 Tax=Psilocybe cf. subviscida TaxID=2480587 RepID=A0A8H5BPN2_9AGAR|nr:hypothetical protein D9619_004614 [Psilocybe cf. subviscida]
MPPRRSTTRASNVLLAPPPSLPPAQPNPEADDLTILRKQWKWAAFSQFYCTFFPLFSLNDVLVVDIERDLVYSTSVTIPRVMQKLLYTLSYDRKISVDNWQNALRKQYLKRDPDANPLGSEPEKTRHSTKELEEPTESLEQKDEKDDGPEQQNDESAHEKPTADEMDTNPDTPAADTEPKADPSTRQSSAVPKEAASDIKEETVPPQAEEESKLVDWFDLPMLTKLETLHTLSEWQFQNPTRLRMVMKSDDELASWRIEPIGYDSKRNAYWYIGDRLWLQREPPKPPRTKPLKRKRAPEKSTREALKPAGTPAKRARIAATPVPSPSPSSGRHSRAAKDQAKLKLDEQAKELAELNRQANMSTSSRPTRQSSRTQAAVKAAPAPPPRPAGTRISARLRGPQQDEEWQPIPEEWLEEEQSMPSKPSKPSRKTGLESDEESELTELSEDGGPAEETAPSPVKGKRKTNGVVSKPQSEEEKEEEHEEPPVEAYPADFVEWETICVTLQEWEHVAERFQNATHYTEKALYKTLINDIVPFIVQELREIERKRELEEALQHRKRSSRLAIRESEKEQAIAAQKKQQEEEEKMSRTRRMEARQQKEEAERLKREAAREQRRQEREAREEARKNLTLQQEADRLAKIEQAEKAEKEKAEKAEKAAKAKAAGAKSKSRTPSGQQENHSGRANGKKKNASSKGAPGGEEWELDCEICHRKGKNLDDGTPMVSCGRCAKWQHIPCHELADRQVGRARRNWESVDFVCKACALAQLDRYRAYPPISQHAASYYNVPQTQSYNRSYNSSQPGQPHIDSRSTQPYIQPRDTAQQSFYMRPPAQNQQIGTHLPSSHGAYPSNSSSHHAPPSQSSLSFNHYQPPSHGYSGTIPQKDSYYSSSYSNGTQQPYASYSHHQPYGQGNQHYRPPVPQPSSYSKPQESLPAWNVTTPANGPGYSSNHNGVPLQSAPSAYRSTAALDSHPDTIPLREPQHPAPSSYARYSSANTIPVHHSPETHYPASASFNKHYPASSYPQQPQSQSPLDR